jgi:hypothetical protein
MQSTFTSMDSRRSQASPQTSLHSVHNHAESDGDNDQYFSEDESLVGDADANGEGPRKRARRPLSVS